MWELSVMVLTHPMISHGGLLYGCGTICNPLKAAGYLRSKHLTSTIKILFLSPLKCVNTSALLLISESGTESEKFIITSISQRLCNVQMQVSL